MFWVSKPSWCIVSKQSKQASLALFLKEGWHAKTVQCCPTFDSFLAFCFVLEKTFHLFVYSNDVSKMELTMRRSLSRCVCCRDASHQLLDPKMVHTYRFGSGAWPKLVDEQWVLMSWSWLIMIVAALSLKQPRFSTVDPWFAWWLAQDFPGTCTSLPFFLWLGCIGQPLNFRRWVRWVVSGEWKRQILEWYVPLWQSSPNFTEPSTGGGMRVINLSLSPKTRSRFRHDRT